VSSLGYTPLGKDSTAYNSNLWGGFPISLSNYSPNFGFLLGFDGNAFVPIQTGTLKSELNLATIATSGDKTDIGLGNVENKSSATIRSEITKSNVVSSLGYTPLDSISTNSFVKNSGDGLTGNYRFNSNGQYNKRDSSVINIKHLSTDTLKYSSIGFSWPSVTSLDTLVAGLSFVGKNTTKGNNNLVLFSRNGTATLNSNGDFTASGNITAFSDRRLKKNITEMPLVSSKLRKISAVEYDRIDNLQHQIGFIAQDFEKEFPELVLTGSDKFKTKSINYQSFTVPLLKGWQEHDTRLFSLEKENIELKREIAELKQLVLKNINSK
jgi:hypothetical protein